MDESNPFETIAVRDPNHFIGRKHEIDLVRRILREGKQFPHRTRNVLITGEEGTGKSSLLLHHITDAQQEKYFCVATHAGQFKVTNAPLVAYLHFFFSELLSQANTSHLLDDDPNVPLYARALKGLPLTDDDLLQLSISPLRFPAWYYGFDHNPTAGVAPIAPWCNDISRLLERAEEKLGVPGCVLALDDVDGLRPTDVQTLLDTVRGIFDAFERSRLMFILAGSSDVHQLVQQQPGVRPIFRDQRTHPWTLVEVGEYVRRPELQSRGFLVGDYRVQELWNITEGSQRILAYLCSRIYQACLSGELAAFEPSESIIEQVSEDIEGVSDQDIVEEIKNLRRPELEELATLAPFNGWTIDEIARYQAFEDQSSAIQSDVRALQQSLQRIRDTYVQRRILRNEPTIAIAGNNLERAFLRFRVRKLGVTWSQRFQDRVPRYDEWAEQAIQAVIDHTSRRMNFPVRKWAMWHSSAQRSPEPLEKRMESWTQDIGDGKGEPSIDYHHQIRMVEIQPGKFEFQLLDVDSPLLDLVSAQQQIEAHLLGLQFAIGNRKDSIVQLYRMPNEGRDNVNQLLEAIAPTATLIDLRNIQSARVRCELPNLEEIISRAERQANADLLSECLFACIALGRTEFAHGQIDSSLKWFHLAANMPAALVPTYELANAHNGYAFVSMAKSNWVTARQEFGTALRMYSEDNTLANRAMTLYDIAYIEAVQGNLEAAVRTCEKALNDPTSATQCGFLYIKLSDIDGLVLREWDAELAREPLVSAACQCTLGAIYSQQGRLDLAEQALNAARKLDASNYMVLRAWGRFYLRVGNYAEARKCFENAMVAYESLRTRLGPNVPANRAIADELEFSRRRE